MLDWLNLHEYLRYRGTDLFVKLKKKNKRKLKFVNSADLQDYIVAK